MPDEDDFDQADSKHSAKVVVIGDQRVGKTSLIHRYAHNEFSLQYRLTVGVDFTLKKVKIEPDRQVVLSFWDIMGQDRYRNVTRPVYQGATACVVVFDVTQPKSMDGAVKWKADLDSKCDLLQANFADFHRTSEEMEAFCQENGFFTWCFVSAKTDYDVGKAMETLTREVIKHTDIGVVVQKDNRPDSVNLRRSGSNASSDGFSKGRCC